MPSRTAFVLISAVFWACQASAEPITQVDPAGDTFGAGFQHDILSLTSEIDPGNSLTFTVDFAGNVSPASMFAANSLAGFLDIDTDQSAATGGVNSAGAFASHATFFGTPFGQPTSGLGAEYYVDLGTELMGQVELVDAGTNLAVASLPITFTPSSFAVEIPLSSLGGDDGLVDYGLIVGDFFPDPSDVAVGSSQRATTPVPEPGSMLLWVLMSVAAVLAVRWKSRSRADRRRAAGTGSVRHFSCLR